MDSKSLMIGDWVLLADGPARVISIAQDGIYFEDKFGRGVCSFDKIQPISLTAEILEKSGFEKRYNYQWEYRDEYCKIVISIAPKIEIEIDGEILGTPPINVKIEGALFELNKTDDWYIHELQHVMRLCGIEKEIVL